MKVISGAAFAGRYPPNSQTGIRKSIAAGAHGMELDVVLSRDGVPVLLHDHIIHAGRLGLASGGFYAGNPTAISQIDFADLAVFDNGFLPPGRWRSLYPDHEGAAPEPIISLTEGLACVRAMAPADFEVLIELKTFPEDRGHSPDPSHLAHACTEVVDQMGLTDSVTFIALELLALDEIRRLRPAARLGLIPWAPAVHESAGSNAVPTMYFGDLLASDGILQLDKVRGRGIDLLDAWSGGLDEVSVAAAQQAGLRVGAWGIIDRLEAGRLASIGVDIVTTPRPDLVLA